MTPDAFAGLWRRRSVTIGDTPAVEPAVVHWIQWGDRFLDMRQPVSGTDPLLLSGPRVFGGTTTWHEPVLTWHHEIDSDERADADAGEVSWAGGDLIERGSFQLDGHRVTYVEVWERVTAPMPTQGRAWSPWPGALAVEVDGHRMAAVAEPGGRWLGAISRHGPDGEWSIVDLVGDDALLDALRHALVHTD